AIEERAVAALKHAPRTAAKPVTPARAADNAMVCTLDVARSRVTSTAVTDVPPKWQEDGCVNDRTQYRPAAGQWSRVLVPNDEDAVTVARYDPEKREYRTERFFLGRTAMDAVRAERAKVEAPACRGGPSAARKLGEQQGAILAMLPQQPNERLIYSCRE